LKGVDDAGCSVLESEKGSPWKQRRVFSGLIWIFSTRLTDRNRVEPAGVSRLKWLCYDVYLPERGTGPQGQRIYPHSF